MAADTRHQRLSLGSPFQSPPLRPTRRINFPVRLTEKMESSASVTTSVTATEHRRGVSMPLLRTTSMNSVTSGLSILKDTSPSFFGQTDCKPCITHQTHRLLPCQHQICYSHSVLGREAARSSQISVCAQCHQTVTRVVEIPCSEEDSINFSHLSSASVDQSTTCSPKHVSSSRPIEQIRDRAYTVPSAEMMPTGPWGHPSFSRQTPVPTQSGFAAPPLPAFPMQQAQASMPTLPYPGQPQFVPQQPRYQFPAQQFPPQQVSTQPFHHQQFIPQHPTAQRYPARPQGRINPVQQFPVYQQPHNFAQSRGLTYQTAGANMATQSQPTYDASATRVHESRVNEPDNSPVRVKTSTVSDPFVEISDYATSASTSAGASRQGSDASYVVVKPQQKVLTEEDKAFAAAMAAEIKSGNWDDPETPRNRPTGVYRRGGMGGLSGLRASAGGHRRGFDSSGGNWPVQQPVQQPPVPAPQPLRPLARQTFPSPDIIPQPPFFKHLADGVLPVVDEAFDHIPFTEMYKRSKPTHIGVVKVSNIPYGTTKNEIVAAIGRQARIVSQPPGTSFPAIHILMERSTGKTLDCFVELESHEEAAAIAHNSNIRWMNSRPARIGDRPVGIDLSSHEELMQMMFPKAKCVTWKNNVPTVYQTDEPFNSGFLGFLTGEEMIMVQKHAENPQRSPFAGRCHNRTYECLISTLHKYPWHAHDYATLGERKLLFDVTLACLKPLMLAISRMSNPGALNRQLLQEVVCAAVTCGGFTHYQHAVLAGQLCAAGFGEILGAVPFMYLAQIGNAWPFEVLSKRPEVGMEHFIFYINLLRQGTISSQYADDPSVYSSDGAYAADDPFGNIVIDYGDEKDKLTLKDAAIKEWNAVEAILRRVLPAQKQILAVQEQQQSGGRGAEEQGQSQEEARREQRQRAISVPELSGLGFGA